MPGLPVRASSAIWRCSSRTSRVSRASICCSRCPRGRSSSCSDRNTRSSRCPTSSPRRRRCSAKPPYSRAVRRALLAAAVVAACLVGVGRGVSAPDPDAVGDLRVLVIRATWGPTADNAAVLSEAADFYRRASFGRLRLQLDITPWLRTYPTAVCPDDEQAAKDAARAAGYSVESYARIAEVLPADVCDFSGVALGPEVLLTDPHVFVHELGHTFGLKHATSYECAGRSCRHIDEYGDPLSPMGHGAVDFSAYEKLKLGWISSVQRADRSRAYAVADIDAPSASPQALVVPTAAGDYWIEH